MHLINQLSFRAEYGVNGIATIAGYCMRIHSGLARSKRLNRTGSMTRYATLWMPVVEASVITRVVFRRFTFGSETGLANAREGDTTETNWMCY